MKNQGKTQAGNGRQVPPGVWNRGSRKQPANPIRVRTKRLDEVDSDKIALAYWLLAKKIVEDQTDTPVSEAEVRRLASEIDDAAPPDISSTPRRSNGGRA